MPTFYSPLRYPGGKNCIFPFMAELIRENGYEGESYAEPFAGGAGLALHLLLEGVVKQIFLNDFDHSIWCFWKTLLNDTRNLCEWVESVPISIDSWNWAKSVYKDMSRDDDFELGTATFFLNRVNVSGIIKGGPIGGPEQKGKFKIDARFNRADLISRIKLIAEHKSDIILSENDGVEFLKKMERKRRKIWLYIDPPYVKKGADLYLNSFKATHHVMLRDMILSLKKDWVMSYDNAELITALYYPCHQIRYTLSQCTSNRMGEEIIIYPNHVTVNKALQYLKAPIKTLGDATGSPELS